MTDKVCAFCQQTKNVGQFSSSEQLRKKARCKDCAREYGKKYREDNKEKLTQKYQEKDKSYCIDCQKPCGKRSKRCITCANKYGRKKIRHPKLCEGCGVELAKRKYKLCHVCNMKTRWSDKQYKDKTTATMRASFDARWANPTIRRKIIKDITTYNGSSKLEKKVAKIGKQFGFEPSIAVGRYLADILNEDRKIIVEVNGDLWHCNPKFWKADDIHPNKKVSAQVIWDRDAKRKDYLESLGYTVLVLWEDDINKGKEKFVKDFFSTIK